LSKIDFRWAIHAGGAVHEPDDVIAGADPAGGGHVFDGTPEELGGEEPRNLGWKVVAPGRRVEDRPMSTKKSNRQ
jgi:hypothetical protein